jgi:chaperonin cofactor prefoldin
LIQENKQLKEQLEQSEGKLRKVEAQLNKTKQWVRELGNIKEDIITLK